MIVASVTERQNPAYLAEWKLFTNLKHPLNRNEGFLH